jgi:very-short-patch-repair endonuclease
VASAFGLSPLEDTLRQVAITESTAFTLATLDTALRRTGIGVVRLDSIGLSVPRRARRAFRLATGKPESGTESVLYLALLDRGLHPRTQVHIPLTDFDRVDLLVGDRLVIECDSEEHHGGAEQRLRDLRRDAVLAGMGFIVLRFDYQQVFFDLDSVLGVVLDYVRRGLHLSDSRFPAGQEG